MTKKYYAFTLVELIVVITILAILAAIGFISLQGNVGDANNSTRKANLTQIEKGVELYGIKIGKYPTPTTSKITLNGSGSTIL